MNTEDLPVAKPCCESWDEMIGDEIRRHCDLCDKDVVNLSEMTQEEAREFLRITPDPCIRYIYTDSGQVVFLHPQLRRQRRGLRRLLGTAALVVPLLFAFAGCDTATVDGKEEPAIAAEPAEEEPAVAPEPAEVSENAMVSASNIIVDARGMARLAIEEAEVSSESDDTESSDEDREVDEELDSSEVASDDTNNDTSDEVEEINPESEAYVLGGIKPPKPINDETSSGGP